MNLWTRREILAAAATGFALARQLIAAQTGGTGGVPRRKFGRHNETIPILALGGWDIGRADDATAIAIMHAAIDEGLTFFDNCWEYHNGRSEELMGRALEGGRRDRVFLMTKVCGRTYEDARANLEDSLRRLRTDRIDLWMFHGIRWDEDPDLIFDAERGAVRAAIEARTAGRVRYIGFTGHKDPKFHLAMLERTARAGAPFEWDAVLMPLNLVDPQHLSFQTAVLPVVVRRGIAALGMKALGAQNGRFVRELGVTAAECRRYSLSLPIASLVCGIQTMDQLRQDLAIAREFRPMTVEETRALLARVDGRNADARLEAYKTGDYGCSIHRRRQAAARGGGAA
ncbi:MAG: aldo/keto reductase [Kiritimatiellae bacterium]|nr:aldo/keto reductase [Kiritimatiellia bacterium]